MEFPLRVQVLEVDSQGIAHVRDELGGYKTVTTAIQRAKGDPPQPGETWIIDRALGGQWTFAAIVNPSLNTGKAGIVQIYAGDGDDPPPGNLWCDGSSLKISDYPELFAAIGTKYGSAGGMVLAGSGAASDAATDITPSVTLDAASEIGSLAVLVVSFPDIYTAPSVASVSGLGATWTQLTEFSMRERYGCRTEVWMGEAGSAGTVITATLTKEAHVGLIGYCVHRGEISEYTLLDQPDISGGKATTSITTASPTDLILTSLILFEAPGMAPVNSAPWTNLENQMVGDGSRDIYMRQWSRSSTYAGKFGEPWLISDPGGFRAFTASITPITNQEPTFDLPDIPDPTLGGDTMRYMISTGRQVSLFGTD